LFEVLNLTKHGKGSIVEIGFGIQFTVGQEVYKSSLLNVLVFSIDSLVFNLFLSVSKMSALSHLNAIGPLIGHLSVLVV
jgi:uncharacterized UPF0146 family protein